MSLRSIPLSIVCLFLLAACGQDQRRHSVTEASSALTQAMAQGRVELTGGLLDLHSPVPGQVRRLAVHLGQDVHQGQLLLELDTHAARLEVALASGQLTRMQAKLAILQANLQHLQQSRQRQEQAAQAGLGSAADAEQAAARWQEQQAQIALAHSDIQLAQTQLEQARYHLAQRRILAPVDGHILQIHTQVGDWLDGSNSHALMVIQPRRPLIVAAEVNEAFIDRLHPGEAAEIDPDDAPPGVHYAARVQYIGEMLIKGHLSEDPQMAHAFECQLRLMPHPGQPALHLGQIVTVKFL